jgi:hypothetical protein
MAVEMLLNMMLVRLAKLLRAATMPKNTSEQMRPYSMEVAPRSSLRKDMICVRMLIHPFYAQSAKKN